MLFACLSIIVSSLNLSNFVDGLEYVEYDVNSTSQEAVFFVDKRDIILIYQNLPNLQINIEANGQKVRNIQNPYPIPKNSIVKVKTNWDNLPIDNYLVGFVNGENCDIIFYSNLVYHSYEPKFLFHLRKCYYHFTKNSTIKIGDKKFKNFALNEYQNEVTTMVSQYSKDDIPEIKGVVSVFHEKPKRNVLEEDVNPEDELIKSGGVFIYALSIALNCVGIILYWIFGFAFGSDRCDCSCSCCCCCKDFWSEHNITNLKYDDRSNDFFTETLSEFRSRSSQVENGE